MSRSQQSDVINTAQATQATDQANATTAVNNEQTDIGNYENQLKSYAAANPYLKGGEFDTTTDQKLSGVADAGSGAINDALQTQAKRTGENATAATATAAEAARQNLRDLSTGEASATQQRIAGEAGYNQQVLSDTAVPAQIEQGIYGTSVQGADQNLSTQAGAAQTPGFWDTLGDSFASGLGKLASGGFIPQSNSGK